MQLLLAVATEGCALAVGVCQRIAEAHDAVRLGAVAKPESMAKLVHRLL